MCKYFYLLYLNTRQFSDCANPLIITLECLHSPQVFILKIQSIATLWLVFSFY